MANFKLAFDKTMVNEGGYSNDPDDAGGETFRGISRVHYPTWEGWLTIDTAKTLGDDVEKAMRDYLPMDDMVGGLYQQHYWDVNRCGDMPQIVADEVFDTGVNMGVARAGEFLQRALNCLNRNGKMYADLVVDGRIGPKTLAALDVLSGQNARSREHLSSSSTSSGSSDLWVLIKIMNVMQGQHYIEYMTKSQTQEKYARGWFGRVIIDKE